MEARAVKLFVAIGLLGALVVVQACSPRQPILPGERLEPRAVLQGAEPSAVAPLDPALLRAVPISLPTPQANSDWTHRGGSASHTIAHPALGAGTALQWSSTVGQGDSRKQRISADPVVAQGRIYTLDSQSTLAATGTNGAPLWAVDLTPAHERSQDASGGGLAFAADRVFATTGYGELLAIDAASGAVQWRHRFDTSVGGAPTVAGNIVYVVARDSTAWALNASDGKVLWQLSATPSASGILGVSSPAVRDQLVVLPFPSGEMVATLRQGGFELWRTRVAGQRMGRAYSSIIDLTGDPVIVGNTVYAGSSAGRAVAISATSGERLWTAEEGAVSSIQVVAGAVFLVSDAGQLLRLNAATGKTVWAVDLPLFQREAPKRQQAIYAHYGPVLAGGRLFVASSDGVLRVFDPASGALVDQAAIAGGAASAPVVAGGVLYVLAQNGQLHAFR